MCYLCNNECHFKRNFPNIKSKAKPQDEGNTTMADGYESIEVLIVASNEARKEWILDLGCYFHMTPNKEWFKTYND